MILPLLIAGASAPDMPTLQRQLDYMVAICRAEDVVRFVAQDKRTVAIEMKQAGGASTVSGNKAFQCALARLKKRDDLKIDTKASAK